MKKGLTELVMILDRSGSMQGLEKDTIGGYNGMLKKQESVDGEVLVSTILFDDVSEVVHDRVPLKEVQPLTEKEYYVRGCTALLDAVGGAVRHIRNIHKYAREEDRPEKTVFVITTDGLENASTSFRYEDVKRLIEQQKEMGWEFLFLGANIDAVKEAGRFGIAGNRAVNFHNDSVGTALNYRVVGEALCSMRKCSAPLADDWAEEIEEDYETRLLGQPSDKADR